MKRRPLGWALVTTLLLGGSGCGGASYSDLCQAACDCSQCSDGELDECMQNGEQLEEAADQLGCSAVWDDYVACLDDNLVCEDGDAEIANGACEAEERALSTDCTIEAG